MDYVEGILLDETLKDLISESQTCYVNDNGNVCGYLSEDDFDYTAILNTLRNSEKAFDGEFYGIQPKLLIVSEDEVRDAVIKITSNAPNKMIDTDKIDTDASLRLRRVLEEAANLKASDIHLRLSSKNDVTEISMRKAGEFVRLWSDQDLEYGISLGRYCAVTLGEKQSFDMNTQVDCTFEITLEIKTADSKGNLVGINKLTKWRFSQIKIDDGSKVTMRALQIGTEKIIPLKELGLSVGHTESLIASVNSAQGAIIMSGPTGSGKTTTINAALSTIKSTRLVHSLEDPVEFLRPGRNHFSTPVNEDFIDGKTGKRTKSFQNYGKVLLRHDTNVLYFGEVRDDEAASIFMRLATTGQVMVGTIHCNSAISIITVIAEQLHVPLSQLAAPGIIKALAHQRLVRTLCCDCKISHKDASAHFQNQENLESACESVEKIGRQRNANVDHVHYRNVGSDCKRCKGTGEEGRTALFELILVDEKGREFIRELRLNDWLKYLNNQNFPTIQDHATKKLLNGLLDYRSIIEEVDGMVKEDLEGIYSRMNLMGEAS